jgi:hypothetical protein
MTLKENNLLVHLISDPVILCHTMLPGIYLCTNICHKQQSMIINKIQAEIKIQERGQKEMKENCTYVPLSNSIDVT